MKGHEHHAEHVEGRQRCSDRQREAGEGLRAGEVEAGLHEGCLNDPVLRVEAAEHRDACDR